MKHITHEPTGLHVTYEIADYLDELDDKAHRRQKRREWLKKLHLLRVLAAVYIGVAAACALVFGLYRLYVHLFPQR